MSPDAPGDQFAHIRRWHDRLEQTGWWHSFELPDGQSIQGVSTLASQRLRISQFPIPSDLSGKRVLDIGTWDGWFAFEMERRGAEVVAVDRFENPHFHEIHDRLRSRVDYRQLSVYDLDPNQIGHFDVVLFMGVLYHLKHPLLALERVCAVARDLVAVESFVLRDRYQPGLAVEDHALMAFYENDEFGGEFDNWVAPTVPCLLAFCRTAGFAEVTLNNVHDHGAAITCRRNWSPSPRSGPLAKLDLLTVYNVANRGINFRASSSDEYVSCRLAPGGITLTRETVQPEVGGYGAPPVFVGEVEGWWQVDFKLPPGLPAGWQEVVVRTPDAESNALRIAVDLPLESAALTIKGIADGVTWEPYRVSASNRFCSIWLHGLPANADLNNVRIRLAGRYQSTVFVSPPNGEGISQINVRILADTPCGVQQLAIRFGNAIAECELEVTA